MTTLTVLKFDTVDGAGKVLSTLESLAKQQLINVYDAAIVEWQEDNLRAAFESEELAVFP